MDFRNRTRECYAIVESVDSNLSEDLPTSSFPREPLIKDQKFQNRLNKSEFIRRALKIEVEIRDTFTKLDTFAKLLRNVPSLQDKSFQVEDLSGLIKVKLGGLKDSTTELENYQKSLSVPGYLVGVPASQSSDEHRRQVVMSLNMKVANAGVQFKNLLEERTRALKLQQSRRERFSAVNTREHSPNYRPADPSISKARTGIERPFSSGDHISIELSGTSNGPKLDQLLTTASSNDVTYLENRNVALQGIEATISELGVVYQQLAAMISEQAETVQRIDTNIEQMSFNVERGQHELARYLRSVSSNRWLLIKIFAILIIFIVFWSIFFL